MSDKGLKVGDFLVENQIISSAQLEDALSMQNDNPEVLVGQILVTQGVLSKEQLISAMEMYMITTGSNIAYMDEWLDQDEVDMLLKKAESN